MGKCNFVLFLMAFVLMGSCSLQDCEDFDTKFLSYREALTAIRLWEFALAEECDTSESSWIDGAEFYSCDEQRGYSLL